MSQRTSGFVGRVREGQVLAELLGALRTGGRSSVLVVRGDAGIGKTALLHTVLDAASGCRVVHVTGVESEFELPFAGLHQLCGPMLDRAEALPAPQRDALAIAFGLVSGPSPDRLMVGLAALTLLSEVCESQPLLCVVDDAQWLDRESALTFGFVGRRLFVERVGLVLATREAVPELAGLPELVIHGLDEVDARTLLGAALRVPLDERVRDRVIAETRGNPLALLEWTRGLSTLR